MTVFLLLLGSSKHVRDLSMLLESSDTYNCEPLSKAISVTSSDYLSKTRCCKIYGSSQSRPGASYSEYESCIISDEMVLKRS